MYICNERPMYISQIAVFTYSAIPLDIKSASLSVVCTYLYFILISDFFSIWFFISFTSLTLFPANMFFLSLYFPLIAKITLFGHLQIYKCLLLLQQDNLLQQNVKL